MKNAIYVLCFLSFVSFFPKISIAEVSSISSGDTLGYEVAVAKQNGNDPIFFQKTNPRTIKIRIDENGDRNYFFESGRVFSITDKFFSRRVNREETVKEEYRFHMFPPDKKIEPGLQWKTSFLYPTTNYGDNRVSYVAETKQGPEVTLYIDGKETVVQTVSVSYEGFVNSTRYSWQGRAENQILYSPELNEIVSSKYIGYDDKGFLTSGYSWTLKFILRNRSTTTK